MWPPAEPDPGLVPPATTLARACPVLIRVHTRAELVLATCMFKMKCSVTVAICITHSEPCTRQQHG